MDRLFPLLCLTAISCLVCGQDPCSNVTYIDIGDDVRTTAYETGIYDIPICDQFTIVQGNWYRFDQVTGGNIPESCPAEWHCGTKHPIWMDDTHPTTDVIATKKICANMGSCCAWTDTIDVKLCINAVENYYVYKLKPPPYCDVAYCAGADIYCPGEQLLNAVNQSCVDHWPAMTSPILSLPIEEIDSNSATFPDRFVFHCSVGYSQLSYDDGARFEVTFLFDGAEDPTSYPITDTSAFTEELPKYTVNSLNPVAKLYDRKLRGRLGKKLSCSVRSYWEGHKNRMSDAASSSTYFAGIVVKSDNNTTDYSPNKCSRFVLNEIWNDPLTISLVSTLPIQCPAQSQPRCSYSIDMKTGDMAQARHCRRSVAPTHWLDSSNYYTSTDDRNDLEVQAKQDPFTKSKGFTSALSFHRMNYFPTDNEYPIWTGYEVDPVRFCVIDRIRSSGCYLYIDPYVQTFDYNWYEMYSTGDFYAYLTRSDPIREVQIRTYKCSGHTCICAVAVREGNEIIGLSKPCNDTHSNWLSPLKVTRYLSGTQPGTVSVHYGYFYEIRMSSGFYVFAYENWLGNLNTFIYPPSNDYQNTEGLCGSWDGNSNNDFEPRASFNESVESTTVTTYEPSFVPSYRVPEGESYFSYPAECRLYPGSVACTCKEKGVVDCSLDATGLPIPVRNSQHECIDGARRRRSASGTYDDLTFSDADIFVPDFPGEDRGPPPETTWPTPGGITEVQAMAACQDSIYGSPVADRCISHVDDGSLIQTCVKDIKTFDSLEMAPEYRKIMHKRCTDAIKFKTELTSDDPAAIEASLALLNDIMDDICPDDCNNRGACSGGKCFCVTGYHGQDCSLVDGEVPSIFGLEKSTCDVKSQPCRTFFVYVTNIDSIPELEGRVYKTEVEFPGVELNVTTEKLVVTTTFISKSEVMCQVNTTVSNVRTYPAYKYDISITNDGENFGPATNFYSYDADCVKCNSDGCELKEGTCIVNGVCSDDEASCLLPGGGGNGLQSYAIALLAIGGVAAVYIN